jgi:hypothetical protein
MHAPHAPQAPRELSALHFEVAGFAEACTPSPAALLSMEAAVAAVQQAAQGLWPEARALLFGSQVWGSPWGAVLLVLEI